jgi:hypothetical protein
VPADERHAPISFMMLEAGPDTALPIRAARYDEVNAVESSSNGVSREGLR